MEVYAEGGTVSENILNELQLELDIKFTEFMLENSNKRTNTVAAASGAAASLGIATMGVGPAAAAAIASGDVSVAGVLTSAAGKLIIFTSTFFKEIST